MAKDIATARPGAKVIGIGPVDVRSFDSLKRAVDRCVEELGGIDFVMYASLLFLPRRLSTSSFVEEEVITMMERYGNGMMHINANGSFIQCRRSRELPRVHQPALRQRLQVRYRYRHLRLIQHAQSYPPTSSQVRREAQGGPGNP